MQDQIEQENKKETLLQNRLSDSEKGNLFAFCQNKGMVHAVEKALLYSIYQMGTVDKSDDELITINWAMSIANANMTSEEKGKKLELLANAVAVLQDAFHQIEKFGVETVKPKEESNPAMGN